MTQDTFQGAKNAFAFLDAYINTVAGEIGTEKALALYTTMTEAVGAAQGMRMKEQVGKDDIDARKAYSLVKAIPDAFGVVFDVQEESPEKVRWRCGQCSVYEGARLAGIEPKITEALCRDGSIRCMDAAVKQLNPNLSYELLKYRTGPDDFCEEQITLSGRH